MPKMDDFLKIARNVGDSASTVATNMAKKSGEFIEISKIRVTIGSKEDKLKELYANIGESVYIKLVNSNDIPKEIEDVCKEIKEVKDEINELNGRINQMMNKKICSNCGIQLNSEVMFCPNCGTKQENEK